MSTSTRTIAIAAEVAVAPSTGDTTTSSVAEVADDASDTWSWMVEALLIVGVAIRRRWERRVMTAEERANWAAAHGPHAVYLASLGGHPAALPRSGGFG